jgi:hypothetical protein
MEILIYCESSVGNGWDLIEDWVLNAYFNAPFKISSLVVY